MSMDLLSLNHILKLKSYIYVKCIMSHPPPERAIDLTNEFFHTVSKQNTVTDYQYFVHELEKLHKDDKLKLFYNIAQRIKELN